MTRVLEFTVPGKPWTTNTAMRWHRMQLVRETRNVREWSYLLTRKAAIDGLVYAPGFVRCRIELFPELTRKAGRKPDPAAFSLYTKAIVDGIVDAGVIPDDSQRYVELVEHPCVTGAEADGVRVVITELEEAG
jgi:crossover junction endodeoxyribonuclease RusA